MKKSLSIAVLCAAAILAACSNMKEPATQALASAESSLSSIREAAAQYAPETLQAVDSKLAEVKKELAAENFKGVLAAAPALTDSIKKLGETVDEKKAALAAAIASATSSWQSLATDMPQMISALQSRMDVLSKSKRLPGNVGQTAFDAAKTGLETLKSGWADAGSAFASGDAVGAVTKAQALKEQGAQILQALGVNAG